MTKQIQTVELPDNLIDDLENVWIAHRDISGTYDFDDMMVNLELSIKKSLAQSQQEAVSAERERIIIELKRVANIGVDAAYELETVTIPKLESLQKGSDENPTNTD